VALTKIVCVGGINIAIEVKVAVGLGKGRKGGVRSDKSEGNGRKLELGSRAPVNDTPINSGAEILGNTLETSIMEFAGSRSKFCESRNGVAYVCWTSSDIGIKEFAKKGGIGEAHVKGKGVIFGSTFGGANGGIEGVDIRRGKGFGGTRARLSVKKGRCFPMMGGKETADVGLTGDLDVVLGLFDVNTIEGFDETFGFERRGSLSRKLQVASNFGVDTISDSRIVSGDDEVINLAKKQGGTSLAQLMYMFCS
jgi:hypothetical protein